MRFRLRTLMIVFALGPPVLSWGWTEYEAYRARSKMCVVPKYPGMGTEIIMYRGQITKEVPFTEP
jgi:hypothetical protein